MTGSLGRSLCSRASSAMPLCHRSLRIRNLEIEIYLVIPRQASYKLQHLDRRIFKPTHKNITYDYRTGIYKRIARYSSTGCPCPCGRHCGHFRPAPALPPPLRDRLCCGHAAARCKSVLPSSHPTGPCFDLSGFAPAAGVRPGIQGGRSLAHSGFGAAWRDRDRKSVV